MALQQIDGKFERDSATKAQHSIIRAELVKGTATTAQIQKLVLDLLDLHAENEVVRS